MRQFSTNRFVVFFVGGSFFLRLFLSLFLFLFFLFFCLFLLFFVLFCFVFVFLRGLFLFCFSFSFCLHKRIELCLSIPLASLNHHQHHHHHHQYYFIHYHLFTPLVLFTEISLLTSLGVSSVFQPISAMLSFYSLRIISTRFNWWFSLHSEWQQVSSDLQDPCENLS